MDTLAISHPAAGVALVTLDRPQRYNSIDATLDREMGQALAALDADAQVRCIVITGAGDKAFCTGADIPSILPMIRQNVAAGRDDPQLAGVTHRNMTAKPLLAAVNGMAFGGGLELALACDLRIASTQAKFGLPEIKLGLLAGAGGVTRLPRMIPAALAAEMILTGEPIDAARALQVGLVSRVVEPGDLMPQALALAQRVAAQAPKSLLACTALLRRARFAELAEALGEERKLFAQLLLTQDAAEGIAAFGQRRPPVWRDA